jgi:hypothetical protein
MDRTIWRENASNIGNDLTHAEDHLASFSKMGGQSGAIEHKGHDSGKATNAGMGLSADDQRKLDDVKARLREARTTNSKLQSANDRQVIKDTASMLYTQLQAAHDSLKDVVSSVGGTPLDKIQPSEKAPVRGFDRDHGGDINQPSDLNQKPPSDLNQKPVNPMNPPSQPTPRTTPPSQNPSDTQSPDNRNPTSPPY